MAKSRRPAAMIFDEIICHRMRAVSGLGEAVLVSVWVGDEERDQLSLEQHVFLTASGGHLHGMSYHRLEADSLFACRERAIEATFRLWARHAGQDATDGVALADGQLAPRAGRVPASESEEPFHGFYLAGEFLNEMQEIMDWTVSARLRSLLVGLLAYRSDASEARLLSRLFSGGNGRTHQVAGRG